VRKAVGGTKGLSQRRDRSTGLVFSPCHGQSPVMDLYAHPRDGAPPSAVSGSSPAAPTVPPTVTAGGVTPLPHPSQGGIPSLLPSSGRPLAHSQPFPPSAALVGGTFLASCSIVGYIGRPFVGGDCVCDATWTGRPMSARVAIRACGREVGTPVDLMRYSKMAKVVFDLLCGCRNLGRTAGCRWGWRGGRMGGGRA
jgi:hypothetical protein